MSPEIVAAIIEASAVLVGAISIIVTVRFTREQLDLGVFSEYTRRYSELWTRILIARALRDSDPRAAAELGPLVGSLFDLWSEEYYLHTRGRVDPRVWDLWSATIAAALQDEELRSAWIQHRGRQLDHQFVTFIDAYASRAPR